MADWKADLDRFLVDTELPVQSGTGSVSQESAETWAQAQYAQFVEVRRAEAETAAENSYIDDLERSAKLLEDEKK